MPPSEGHGGLKNLNMTNKYNKQTSLIHRLGAKLYYLGDLCSLFKKIQCSQYSKAFSIFVRPLDGHNNDS
jgi:hypothetical protein